MRAGLRQAIIGPPLSTAVALEHRLPIFLALPVFASDAISSVAYGPQEVMIQLAAVSVAGGGAAIRAMIPICIAIALLMLIVATSYRRAVHLYPTSGGSYTVAKSNLGPFIGLVAAAALLIDYIMTVAVSISSGVDALTSSFPVLKPEHVVLAILLVVFITLINLRGTKESGWAFALPMYVFASMVGLMVLVTVISYLTGHFHVMGSSPALPANLQLPSDVIKPDPLKLLGFFIILRAFSNGCSAMTGVEAVSNGVSAFEPPEAKNAAKTLLLLVSILIFLFLGTALAAYLYHALPADSETLLSQVTRATFGRTLPYFITQFATLVILMVAANTSFADFPRVLAFVARDGFAPKAFNTQGDRLVYNRGIIVLALISILVIWHFKADVTQLIGLYSIGVFLCFTLSQVGMAKKIHALREKNWMQGTVINLIGATVTGLVTIVVAVTKFSEGAWMVLILIPVIIGICIIIKRHYEWFDRTMSVSPSDYNPLAEPLELLTVLVLISSDVHRGTLEGLEAGRVIAAGNSGSVFRAVHIEMDSEKTERLKKRWAEFVEPYIGQSIRLDIIPSPYRWLIEPLREYLDKTEAEQHGDRMIVVLPEFETGNLLTNSLHNFTGNRLRAELLNRPNLTVVSSRFIMQSMASRKTLQEWAGVD